MGHDPDRPCVGESGGIPLITIIQGPGRDWSFAPMGLVLVCDTPLICRKGRMFNAPDVLISQAALCLCLVPRPTTLDMVSMWKLFMWKFYVKYFYWVEMCWLDGCWLVTQTGFSKAHMANKGKCYSGDSFNGLLLCIAS